MKVNEEDTSIAMFEAVISGHGHKIVTKDGREILFVDTIGLEMHLMRSDEGLGLLGLAFDLEGMDSEPLGLVIPMLAVPSMIERLAELVREDAKTVRTAPAQGRG